MSEREQRRETTDRPSAAPERPAWSSWQQIDAELPKWNSWLTLAGEGSDPARAEPLPAERRADPPPPAQDPLRARKAETMKGIQLGIGPAPIPEPQPEPRTDARMRGYRHRPIQGDGGPGQPAFRTLVDIEQDDDPDEVLHGDGGPVHTADAEIAPPEPAVEPESEPYSVPEPAPEPEPASRVAPPSAPTREQASEPHPAFEPEPEAPTRIEGDGFSGVEIHQAHIFEPSPDAPSEESEDDAPAVPASPNPVTTPGTDDGAEPFSAIDLRDRVVIMLLFQQIVQVEQVEKAWYTWQKMLAAGSKEPLWRVLTQDPSMDRDRIFAEAAQVYAFKEAQINRAAVLKFLKDRKDAFTEAQWDRMRKLHLIPIAEEKLPQGKDRRVVFVAYDPTWTEIHRLLKELKLDSYELQYLPEGEINSLIAEAFPKKNEFLERMTEDPFAFDLGTTYDKGKELIDEEALEAEINRSSLINLFEASLVEAVRQGASDIHIFPNARKQIEIHFRIDGELNRWHAEERVHPEAFLAVVKDNALNVDRFERDAAQDGFIQRWIDDALIRYRVSVLPIANANQEIRSESIVIRVLDDRKVVTNLRQLGLLDTALKRFDWAIRQPHGMVILTGPTGSGKSTTLFAALHQVVTPKLNVLTVEDPVEYIIPGVRQIKLNHKLNLEGALRSILRHDPDVVMVGEMRDRQTAELAIKLANTGHLTFSTLHTNDAPSAVSRLYKMGIEPFLIAYAINLVVAQRLLRKLCPACRCVDRDQDPETLSHLGFTPEEIATTTFYTEGANPKCPTCKGTGYKGRRAVTETLLFSREIRRIIVTTKEMIDEDAIRETAVREGMLTLRDSAREVVKWGETSIVEMVRVTAGEL